MPQKRVKFFYKTSLVLRLTLVSISRGFLAFAGDELTKNSFYFFLCPLWSNRNAARRLDSVHRVVIFQSCHRHTAVSQSGLWGKKW